MSGLHHHPLTSPTPHTNDNVYLLVDIHKLYIFRISSIHHSKKFFYLIHKPLNIFLNLKAYKGLDRVPSRVSMNIKSVKRHDLKHENSRS